MEQSPFYESYRPLLTGLAYRMLGSRSDAEDVVQDVFAQYYQMCVAEEKVIEQPKAYLIRMTTNRCLNVQGSARKRRETYIGNWLPEPSVLYVDDTNIDPAALWDKNESVTYAMLVMLERLGPVERAVFLLRETFAYEYEEIGEILGKSEAACRKINSRARKKLQAEDDLPELDIHQAGSLAQAFRQATETGNIDSLLALLTEDAVLLSDGGGKARAAIFPIIGRRRILAFLAGLHRKGKFKAGFLPAAVNGQAGMVLLLGDASGAGHCPDLQPSQEDLRRYPEDMPQPLPQPSTSRSPMDSARSPGIQRPVGMVLTFRWDERGERIKEIYIVVNPDKLAHVTKQDAELS